MCLIILMFYFLKLECSSVSILCTITEVIKQNYICALFCLGSNFVYELYSECFHFK